MQHIFKAATLGSLALLVVAILACGALAAEGNGPNATLGSAQTSSSISPEDTALLDAVRDLAASATDKTIEPSLGALGALADAALAEGPAERELPELHDANGVSLRETVNAPLSRILDYAYNPDVPSYLVLPSVVRFAGWYPGSDILGLDAPLSSKLPAPQSPVVLHGREFEEITPDLFSGGYYRYDMQRLLALFDHNGRSVLISVAVQDGPSDVGKKGVVLDDGKWQ